MKHTHLALRLALASSLAALPAAAADVYTIDAAHTEVSFQIRHLVTNVRGRFTDFAGTIVFDKANAASSSVELTIQATSIDTDHPERDTHLRSEDFFWVEKFPEITFRSGKVENVDEDTYKVAGTLTIRGVAKPVELMVDVLGEATDPWGNAKAGFATETEIDRKEFGIEWNKALDSGGFILGDEVEVDINIEAGRQAS